MRANQALYDYCTAFGVPCISGKDSMKNDYHIGEMKISVPPTLLFSVIARMPNVRRAITMDVKQPGDLVFMVGETRAELGASEYYALHGAIGNRVPQVDAQRARVVYNALSQAIQHDRVNACHDCSDGGFGVAAAEMACAGGFGMRLDLRAMPRESDIDRNDTLLYAETASRFVVTVPPQYREAFCQLLQDCAIGEVGYVRDMLGTPPSLRAGSGCLRATLGCLTSVFGGCAPERAALRYRLYSLFTRAPRTGKPMSPHPHAS